MMNKINLYPYYKLKHDLKRGESTQYKTWPYIIYRLPL